MFVCVGGRVFQAQGQQNMPDVHTQMYYHLLTDFANQYIKSTVCVFLQYATRPCRRCK